MRFLQKEKAFTLIEVMVAIVIGVVLIIAFSAFIINSFKAELRMDDRMEAARISDSIIEQLHGKNLSNWSAVLTDINNSIDVEVSNNTEADITVKLTKENTTDNLYLVRIVWEDRNYEIETLLAGD